VKTETTPDLIALLHILIDGQAVLYSQIMALESRYLEGPLVTETQILAWQDDWKTQTADLFMATGLGDDTE